jgi:hypothetical protein
MGPVEFYKKINAPLHSMYSWGGRRPNGDIVFSVWWNVPQEFNYKRREALIGYTKEFRTAVYNDSVDSFYAKEREQMVQEYLSGSRGYLVMREQMPVKSGGVTTKSMRTDVLFPIIDHRVGEYGEVWAIFGSPIKSSKFYSNEVFA